MVYAESTPVARQPYVARPEPAYPACESLDPAAPRLHPTLAVTGILAELLICCLEFGLNPTCQALSAGGVNL